MPASHVNFEGMLLSLVNAGLVIVSAPATRNAIMRSLLIQQWQKSQ